MTSRISTGREKTGKRDGTVIARADALEVEPSQGQRPAEEEAVVDADLGRGVDALHDASGDRQLQHLQPANVRNYRTGAEIQLNRHVRQDP